MEIDEFVLASYTPRSFYIQLNEPMFSEPGPNGTLKFTPQNFPVFMHEVAHLVQDRATFRGVIDFLDLWDRVSAIAKHVRSLNGTIEIPLFDARTGLSRLAGNINWAVETDKIRQLREPKIKWADNGSAWAYTRHETRLVVAPLDGKQITYPVTTVYFVDNVSGDEYQHTLGAWEIKEAYSVAVSLIHGGPLHEYGKTNFEYLVIERILNRFFGAVTPQQTIAICHWCLQDLAPATVFFSLIQHFEFQELPSAELIYRHARAEALSRGFERNVLDILATVEEYRVALGAQEPLRVLFGWYIEHAARLLTLHLAEDRIFPLDTFLCDANPYDAANIQDKGLELFFQEVEIPLIVWPNGDTTAICSDLTVTESAVFLNQSVFNLSDKLWTSKDAVWACPNFQGCHLPMKDDHECLHTPWKQVRHFPACPYGAAAKLMALNESIDILAE